jgi:hypothetical protein
VVLEDQKFLLWRGGGLFLGERELVVQPLDSLASGKNPQHQCCTP